MTSAFSAGPRRRARSSFSAVTSHSSTKVKCAAVCTERLMPSKMRLRMPRRDALVLRVIGGAAGGDPLRRARDGRGRRGRREGQADLAARALRRGRALRGGLDRGAGRGLGGVRGLDVVADDAAVGAGGRDRAQVDAELARQLARGRRGERLLVEIGLFCRVSVGLAGRGRAREVHPRERLFDVTHGCRGGLALGVRRRCDGGRVAAVAEVEDHEDRVDRHDAALGAAGLEDLAGLGGGDRHRRLVGHDLDHGLVFLDRVALGDEPLTISPSVTPSPMSGSLNS